MIRKYAESFCWKMWVAFATLNCSILYIESAKIVNEMTLNELVKLTTLWTTGPWTPTVIVTQSNSYTTSLQPLTHPYWLSIKSLSDIAAYFLIKSPEVSVCPCQGSSLHPRYWQPWSRYSCFLAELLPPRTPAATTVPLLLMTVVGPYS